MLDFLPYSIRRLGRHYDSFVWTLDYLSWRVLHSGRLARFKDLHKGESCFIIGNGPSLTTMNLRPLVNYHTFGLNKIYLMFDKVDLNLSYHVAVNPYVIKQAYKEFESLSCPTFLAFGAAHHLIRDLAHVYFLFEGPLVFQTDISKAFYGGYTVTFVALQIAFYMGFSKVFLIGVDHHFQTKGSPGEAQLLQGDDINHFDLKYFSGHEWQLPDLKASESSYRLAQSSYKKNGREIYDATVHGKLRVFPKISYKEALLLSSQKT